MKRIALISIFTAAAAIFGVVKPSSAETTVPMDDLTLVGETAPPAAPAAEPDADRPAGYQYPRFQNPQFQYPRVQSPRFQYPRFQSPRFQYPRVQYPRFQYPRFQSPRFQYPHRGI